MSRYVIDAPTLLRLIDAEQPVDADHQLVAPGRIRSDALELLLRAVRSAELTEREALARHTKVTELKMRLLNDRGSRGLAWAIAREHDWDSIHDAEYLALTRLQGDALVTVDPCLAAKAAGIVPLSPFDALTAPDR
ncbi:type II toxin-antitoxin system VapC family toxin [Flexivirga caeni]|uniref:PIN domain-containing protein n=1 Tax=Flexivirga caeni TaxID=2294115 RepID=A0A3M9MFA2_9MICO|nr:hypothetical protein [Flexivirga caeni]RNI24231.1 hypothetical protein EFY87_04480 [Flexivirga caeni]